MTDNIFDPGQIVVVNASVWSGSQVREALAENPGGFIGRGRETCAITVLAAREG